MRDPSTELSTGVDYLLEELTRVREERRKIQRQLCATRASRDMWKGRAKAAEWAIGLKSWASFADTGGMTNARSY